MKNIFLYYSLPFVLSITSPLVLGYFLVRNQICNGILIASLIATVYILLHIPLEIARAKSKGEKFNKKKYFFNFISGLIIYTFFLIGASYSLVRTSPIIRNWLLGL